jgi:hypothetical protein
VPLKQADFTTITVPDERPADWPFENWMSFAEARGGVSWGFQLLDMWLKDEAGRPNYPADKFVFGFVVGEDAYANVMLKQRVAYIGMDFLLLPTALCFACTPAFEIGKAYAALDEKIGEYMAKVAQVANGPRGKIKQRAAIAAMNFVISHELGHIAGGNFQLKRENVSARERVHAMELCADIAGFGNAFMALVRPMVAGDGDPDDVLDGFETFGFTLANLLLFKHGPETPGSLYPTITERLTFLMGYCLTGCAGRGGAGRKLGSAFKYSIMVGIRKALVAAAALQRVSLPRSLARLAEEDYLPQRLNCVGCSPWARHVYEDSRQLFELVAGQRELLKKYAASSFGFHPAYFHLAETYENRERRLCHLDYPNPLMRSFVSAGQWLKSRL